MPQKKESSSWEPVSGWYDKVVGSKGHYYHENVILPKLKPTLTETKSLLDLA
ncbi:MAG: SAM-dependent methyltransferase, partial [Chlamydiae bacterium]|nr:SAM-dependent methyltransferase [Chlamydiota bacterium]